MYRWIIWAVVLVVIIGAYVWMFRFARKRQRTFDEQYNAMKERHEVFVLSKKVAKERPKSRWMKYVRVKTYQVVGRVNVSQAVRGIQMSRMQTMTFQTTKQEFEKIQPNHKYKMDIAGNYIGFVNAPAPVKGKKGKNDKAKKDSKAGKLTKKSK